VKLYCFIQKVNFFVSELFIQVQTVTGEVEVVRHRLKLHMNQNRNYLSRHKWDRLDSKQRGLMSLQFHMHLSIHLQGYDPHCQLK